MPGIAEIVGAIVKALWEPILRWLTVYQSGRTAQQKADAEASLSKQQEVTDAVAKARGDSERLGVGGDDWLRRDSPPPP